MTAIDDVAGIEVDVDVPERWRLGANLVPKSRYVDPEFLALERERLFPRTWIPACREEEIPEVGDYVEFDVVGESIVLVRESADTINAFFNACRHRGTRLARGRGRIGNFRCPFHAWQYALDGTNTYVHDPEDFAQLTPEYLCLRRCRTGQWAGYVFVNIDANAEPLENYLAPLPERLGALDIGAMRYAWYKSFVMGCNWKTAVEAFSESYHVPGTHPQLIRPHDHDLRPASRRELLGDPSHAPTQVLGRNVSRYFVEPRDPAHPRYADKESLLAMADYHVKELRALQTERDVRAIEELIEIGADDGPTLYGSYKSKLRDVSLADGLDWPEIPADVRQKAEGSYCIFANMIILVRQGNLLGYRAMPNGSDADSCIFDAYALELFPPGEEPPFAREFHTDWHGVDIGEILAQDFANMEDVAVGIHTPAFERAVLSPLQETTVFHRQVVLDRYLFGSDVPGR